MFLIFMKYFCITVQLKFYFLRKTKKPTCQKIYWKIHMLVQKTSDNAHDSLWHTLNKNFFLSQNRHHLLYPQFNANSGWVQSAHRASSYINHSQFQNFELINPGESCIFIRPYSGKLGRVAEPGAATLLISLSKTVQRKQRLKQKPDRTR